MRKGFRAFLGLTVLAVSSACYHATIETGLPASSETISIPWAHGFVYGLVPPAAVNSASKCKNGVAKVETQHSVLNMLAQWLTFGLYTPIQIDVTCASSNRMASASEPGVRAKGETVEARSAAVAEAVALSLKLNQAVFVTF